VGQRLLGGQRGHESQRYGQAFDLVAASNPAGQSGGRQRPEQCIIPDHFGDQFLRAALAAHVGNQVGRLLAMERKLNRTKRSISDRLLRVNRQTPAAAASTET